MPYCHFCKKRQIWQCVAGNIEQKKLKIYFILLKRKWPKQLFLLIYERVSHLAHKFKRLTLFGIEKGKNMVYDDWIMTQKKIIDTTFRITTFIRLVTADSRLFNKMSPWTHNVRMESDGNYHSGTRRFSALTKSAIVLIHYVV